MDTNTTMSGRTAGARPRPWAASRGGVLAWALAALAWLLLAVAPQHANAQETVCARVKIEIKQELTLERQAFDAEMKISNTLDASSLTDVGVVVKVTDEAGVPVAVSDDPNNTSAKFFIRVTNRQNIGSIDGTGAVAAATTATINWLLAGVHPTGLNA